jgi:hypothetical protein
LGAEALTEVGVNFVMLLTLTTPQAAPPQCMSCGRCELVPLLVVPTAQALVALIAVTSSRPAACPR